MINITSEKIDGSIEVLTGNLSGMTWRCRQAEQILSLRVTVRSILH